jgi:hypothetical protein
VFTVKGGVFLLARRKNILSDDELAVVKKKTKSFVETFDEAMSLFVKDCELDLIQYILPD